MKKLILAVAMVLALPVASAWAGDMEGKVKQIEINQRVLTLEDGTKLYWTDSVTVKEIKQGAQVKATYEEKDGKFVLTNIQIVK
jgi:Cu/Ag efflux protein CusF